MVRDAAQFERRDLSHDGDAANPWYYEMHELGWNYRLPDLLCALGTSQLAKLSQFMARRRAIVAMYDRLLAPLSPVLRPVPHGNRPHGWHIYAVLIDYAALGMTRAKAMQSLRARGIGTQVHYIPLHWQPYYREHCGEMSLPGAEAYYARCLSIPFYPAMSDADVGRVASALAAVVEGRVQ
jgi:dTDP-4-amino-4,6-dideoxygalactose transaminase